MRRADIEVPNTAVDVDSWAVSACYPQGSFYPLSDGPSTRNHRITKPDFRPCSTCWSRSQAPFCLYTLRAISVRTEGTFGRLRYSLGGDRPSLTAHLTLSVCQFMANRYNPSNRRVVSKGRLHVSRSRHFLVSHLSCASVTVIQYQVTVKLYGVFPSSRGLIRIFTHSSISPGPLLRQRPSRYAIRAGRNLPDKEFRYLRTVIVTAAVHWGLNSTLRLR